MSSWYNAMQQSFNSNRILDHCNILSVATISNSLPAVDQIRFQYFSESGIAFFLDQRSRLCSSLITQPSEFLWHLPLTNEYYKFTGSVQIIPSEEIRIAHWNKLSPREKEGFYGLPPDTSVDSFERVNDIDSFKPQEAFNVSQNFAIVHVSPSYVEHSVFPDKSAIGNTRKTYESLPQPDATSKKWIHRLVDGEWHITQMHISAIRP